MLSGSGGACFALLAGANEARELADRLRAPADTTVHVVPFAASATFVDSPA
jgi:4-diphosphocytidyl-2C-methyl-D-erythritol kinase